MTASGDDEVMLLRSTADSDAAKPAIATDETTRSGATFANWQPEGHDAAASRPKMGAI